MTEPRQTRPVGYASPPEHTRFPAGRSGNPAGRPKAVPDLATTLNRALARKVTVAGQTEKVTLWQALVRRLRELAQLGDRRAQKLQAEIMALREAQVLRDHGPNRLDVMAIRRELARRLGHKLPASMDAGDTDGTDGTDGTDEPAGGPTHGK